MKALYASILFKEWISSAKLDKQVDPVTNPYISFMEK